MAVMSQRPGAHQARAESAICHQDQGRAARKFETVPLHPTCRPASGRPERSHSINSFMMAKSRPSRWICRSGKLIPSCSALLVGTRGCWRSFVSSSVKRIRKTKASYCLWRRRWHGGRPFKLSCLEVGYSPTYAGNGPRMILSGTVTLKRPLQLRHGIIWSSICAPPIPVET